jgi:hypothetical protein
MSRRNPTHPWMTVTRPGRVLIVVCSGRGTHPLQRIARVRAGYRQDIPEAHQVEVVYLRNAIEPDTDETVREEGGPHRKHRLTCRRCRVDLPLRGEKLEAFVLGLPPTVSKVDLSEISS